MVACLSFRGRRKQESFSVFQGNLGVLIVVCGGGGLTRLMPLGGPRVDDVEEPSWTLESLENWGGIASRDI